jgi:hypothetical protein
MNQNIPKISQFFNCEKCKLNTSNKKDFKKHCMTSKHINNHNLEYLEQKNPKNPFICKYCDKGYNARNSLWYHEKKCKNDKTNTHHDDHCDNYHFIYHGRDGGR